jgi:hypothetical protein
LPGQRIWSVTGNRLVKEHNSGNAQATETGTLDARTPVVAHVWGQPEVERDRVWSVERGLCSVGCGVWIVECGGSARVLQLFGAYTGERAWKPISDRLQQPRYLNRVHHGRRIRSRKQETDIGKYSFVNRTLQLWML